MVCAGGRGHCHPKIRRAAAGQDVALHNFCSKCLHWVLSPCRLWLLGDCWLAGSAPIKHVLLMSDSASILLWVSCSAKPCKCLLHLHHYFYQLSLSSHQRIFDKTCFQETTAVKHLGTFENMPGIYLNLGAPHIYKIWLSVPYYSKVSYLWGIFLSFYCWSWRPLRIHFLKKKETMI